LTPKAGIAVLHRHQFAGAHLDAGYVGVGIAADFHDVEPAAIDKPHGQAFGTKPLGLNVDHGRQYLFEMRSERGPSIDLLGETERRASLGYCACRDDNCGTERDRFDDSALLYWLKARSLPALRSATSRSPSASGIGRTK
jgi:hypothetical protein